MRAGIVTRFRRSSSFSRSATLHNTGTMTSVRDETAYVGSWWAGVTPSKAVAERLSEIALDRARVFLPIVIVAMLIALPVSEPSGIPLTRSILVVNAIVIGC